MEISIKVFVIVKRLSCKFQYCISSEFLTDLNHRFLSKNCNLLLCQSWLPFHLINLFLEQSLL